MAWRMPGWMRTLFLGPTAADAEEERREAYREYVKRMEYESALRADFAEHERIKDSIAEMDRRLGEVERSISASEAELQMHSRTIN